MTLTNCTIFGNSAAVSGGATGESLLVTRLPLQIQPILISQPIVSVECGEDLRIVDRRSRCWVSWWMRDLTSPAMVVIVRASTPSSPPASVGGLTS